MILDELFTRGGPVLYLLFLLTFLIFLVLINKYFFLIYDKKFWLDKNLNNFINDNPPSQVS